MFSHSTHPITKHRIWKFLKFYINYFRSLVQDTSWVGVVTYIVLSSMIFYWFIACNLQFCNQLEIIVSCYGFWDSFRESQYTIMYYSLLLDGSVKALWFMLVTLLYVKLEFLIGCTCWYYRKILWLLEIFYFQFGSMLGYAAPFGNVFTFHESGILLGLYIRISSVVT